eukprot:gb/GFBE01047915.1/.p1 GENE.gb/GFBE01047915.1/~~gb/GFBE01047915.1/.p1  ORF type:complete len:409 (+),score=96.75 gb/GFBE01047915.1/:1-1227(+)
MGPLQGMAQPRLTTALVPANTAVHGRAVPGLSAVPRPVLRRRGTAQVAVGATGIRPLVPFYCAAMVGIQRRHRSSRRIAARAQEDDTVASLERAAQKLREEAAQLASEVDEGLRQQQLRWFQRFDVDNTGALSVRELRQGMLQWCEEDVSEVVAKRLLEEHDVNKDGKLQPSEFNLRSLKASLRQIEADIATKEAKMEAEAREREEEQRQLEEYKATLPVANDDTGLIVRLSSILVYVLPILDSLRFGAPLLVLAPAALSFMMPWYMLLVVVNAIPFGQLLLFFGLSSLSDKCELPVLFRYNCRQAMELDVAVCLFKLFCDLMFFLAYGSSPDELTQQLDGTNLALTMGFIAYLALGVLVFFLMWACVAYSAASSLLGLTPNGIPYLSAVTEERLPKTRPRDQEELTD